MAAEAVIGPDESQLVVEFHTHMRGREVACRWTGGRLTGDPELLARMRRCGDLPTPDGDVPVAVAIAHLVEDAVGSEVVIRVIEP